MSINGGGTAQYTAVSALSQLFLLLYISLWLILTTINCCQYFHKGNNGINSTAQPGVKNSKITQRTVCQSRLSHLACCASAAAGKGVAVLPRTSTDSSAAIVCSMRDRRQRRFDVNHIPSLAQSLNIKKKSLGFRI